MTPRVARRDRVDFGGLPYPRERRLRRRRGEFCRGPGAERTAWLVLVPSRLVWLRDSVTATALVQIAGAVRASLAAAPFLALTRTSSQLRISRPVAYDVAGPLGDVSDMQKDVAGTTPAGFVSAILQKVMPSIYAATAPILREER